MNWNVTITPHNLDAGNWTRPGRGNDACARPPWSWPVCPSAEWARSASPGRPAGCPGWAWPGHEPRAALRHLRGERKEQSHDSQLKKREKHSFVGTRVSHNNCNLLPCTPAKTLVWIYLNFEYNILSTLLSFLPLLILFISITHHHRFIFNEKFIFATTLLFLLPQYFSVTHPFHQDVWK